MTPTCLTLIDDPRLYRMFNTVLVAAGIGTEVASTAAEALRMMESRKFEAAVIDCNLVKDAVHVIAGLRRTPSSQRAVIIALTGPGCSIQEAFGRGATFVLDPPVSPERASRILRSSFGLIVREWRRYRREPLNIPVAVTVNGSRLPKAMAVDISEGGLGLQLEAPLPAGTAVELRFSLTEGGLPLLGVGEVAWSKTDGRAGVRFVQLQPISARQLQDWLAQAVDRLVIGRGHSAPAVQASESLVFQNGVSTVQ